MRLQHPDLLWVIPALALGAAALVGWWASRRLDAARALGSLGLLQRLTALEFHRFPRRRLLLVVAAAVLIGVALVGPQWGARIVTSEARGLDVVLALDVSASMRAGDLAPSRLERQRTEARRLLREMPGDRVGLVIFAGRAYVLAPVTSDHAALELFLDALDPEIAGTPGTSLAAGVRQATDLLRTTQSNADRVVVLFSDGEAHESEETIAAAARRAREAGVRVYAVGVGTERGEPVPEVDPASGRVVGYKRDREGKVVLSRLDPGALERLAQATGGAFVRVDEGGVGRLTSAFQSLKREARSEMRRLEWTPRYHWFALIGFTLLAVDLFLGTQRVRPWSP